MLHDDICLSFSVVIYLNGGLNIITSYPPPLTPKILAIVQRWRQGFAAPVCILWLALHCASGCRLDLRHSLLREAGPLLGLLSLPLNIFTAWNNYCTADHVWFCCGWQCPREMENISRGSTFGDFVMLLHNVKQHDVNVTWRNVTKRSCTKRKVFKT